MDGQAPSSFKANRKLNLSKEKNLNQSICCRQGMRCCTDSARRGRRTAAGPPWRWCRQYSRSTPRRPVTSCEYSIRTDIRNILIHIYIYTFYCIALRIMKVLKMETLVAIILSCVLITRNDYTQLDNFSFIDAFNNLLNI